MYEYAEKKNLTGIPDGMKAQFEAGSGFSFDDVRVHYNSVLPARMGAYAYTQGNQVYLGAGQERHLGHELGHVVQQKQGIVKKIGTINGVSFNDDINMEHDADRMANLWKGSVRVDRPIQRKKGSVAAYANPVRGVVQRKVGMEFQVMAGGRDVLDSDGNSCGHGVLLKKENGYDITGDMGDYEYVVDPIDERTDAGVERLKQCCKEAGEAHKNIFSELQLVPTKSDEYMEYTVQDGGSAATCNIRQSKCTKAHPQATVGIKLDKLGKFVEEYMREDKTYQMPYQRKPTILRLDHGGTKKNIAAGQVKVLKSIGKKNAHVIGGMKPFSEESGFLSILASMVQNFYLYYSKRRDFPVNAKSAMPLMPRTSLYDAFLKLPQTFQDRLKNLGDGTEVSNQMLRRIVGSSLARKNGHGIRVVDSPNKDMMQAVIAAETPFDPPDDRLENVISIEEWVASLPAVPISSPDIFENFNGVSALYGEVSASEDEKELYSGMKRSTDIGYDADEQHKVEGMLIELRDLQRGVDCALWGTVARDVALLTRYVNTGSILDPAKALGELKQPPARKSKYQAQITIPRVGRQRR